MIQNQFLSKYITSQCSKLSPYLSPIHNGKLVIMFYNRGNKQEKEENTGVYEPGVYTSCVTLNGNPMDVKVTLDDNHINSITVDNVSNTITTMYPLVEPAFNDIANQIVTNQSLENIKFDDNSKYTYTILYNAIQDTIEKGKVGE